jgi:hypothetical protein
MKKLHTIFFILLFSFNSSFVLSDDTTNLSGYWGCGLLLSDCDKSKLHINCQAQTKWVQGYISSLTYRQDLYFPKSSFAQEPIKYALINYCRQNPFKDTHDAAENIFNQLK